MSVFWEKDKLTESNIEVYRCNLARFHSFKGAD